jgi:hypothetical protein
VQQIQFTEYRYQQPRQVKASSFQGLMNQSLRIIRTSDWSVYEISEITATRGRRVSPSTIFHWLNGSTTSPRLSTLNVVLNALGYEISINKK